MLDIFIPLLLNQTKHLECNLIFSFLVMVTTSTILPNIGGSGWEYERHTDKETYVDVIMDEVPDIIVASVSQVHPFSLVVLCSCVCCIYV